MFQLQDNPGRTVKINGKEFLFFSGYAYLGMHHVPAFAELVKEGIDKYGWLFPSSRVSNTQLDIFSELESKLSEITGTEDTVCFSSGFLAGRSVATLFQQYVCSCAPQTHPAICLEKSRFDNFNKWKQNIGEADVILFDSVNPLSAEINDTTFLSGMKNEVVCVIDDSHGIGILNEGKGIGAGLVQKHDYLLTYSLSKAYNLIGGAVSCSRRNADKLRASSCYTASSPLAPAFAYAFLNGQKLYDQQREKLLKNIALFNTITKGKFQSHDQLPICILGDDFDERALADAGIIISSFAYPDPAGKKISRMVINALHTEEDLHRLAAALG